MAMGRNNMDRTKYLAVLRLVLVVVFALFWVVGQCLAQTQQSPAQTGPFRSSQNVMPMQKTTNAQRRAAAERTASRRAGDAKKTQNAPNPQGAR
jgi:hypothetical protein